MPKKKCPHCGSQMVLLSKQDLNIGLLLIFLFLGLIPGIIYYIWAAWDNNWICKECTANFVKDAYSNNKRKR